jgi:hypothetical protein
MGEDVRKIGVARFDQANPIQTARDEYAGDNDYQLDSIKIISASGADIDISNVFIGASIYEDIFSNTMSAAVSFQDTNNLVKHLPIIGQQEKLEIIFKIPGESNVTYNFDIFRVSVRTLSTVGKKQSVTLNAVSTEQFKNIHTKVSKSYYAPIHETIKNIYDEFLSGDKKLDIQVDTDSEKRKFIIPNWHPLDAIDWLKQRAIPSDNPDACHYLFYEDRDGFKFTTIEKLFEVKKPKMEYFYMPRRYRDTNTRFRDPGYEFRNIQRLIIEEPGDRLEENIRGMYGSKILTHDIVRKKYKFTEYSMKNEYKKTDHVEKEYPIAEKIDKFSDNPDTYFALQPIHKNLNMENDRGGDTVEQNEKYSKWLLKRKSLLRQIGSQVVNVHISGDSRRKCGDVVLLQVTPLEPGTIEDHNIDKYISGKYLVTSIKHNLTPDGYWMDMELGKDSVQEPYPEESNFLKEEG